MIFDRYRFNEQVAMELGEKILLAIVALIVTWLEDGIVAVRCKGLVTNFRGLVLGCIEADFCCN